MAEYNKELHSGLNFIMKLHYRLVPITKQQIIINYSKFTCIKNKEWREEIYFKDATTNE